MVHSRRAGIVVLVVVLAVGLCAALADGKKKRKKRRPVGTQVTLTHPSEAQFTGTVTSKRFACRNQRLVNVYYTDPSTAQTRPLAVERTDTLGNYQVDLVKPAFGGTYLAQAPSVSERGSLLCRAGESNPVVVPVVPLTP